MWSPGKKILVTGSRGQLGYQLLSSVSKKEVIALSQSSLDFADAATCIKALDQQKPEVVVNCAAYTAVDNAEKEQNQAFVANAEGPGLLAEWCEANDSHLVHISTDYVFSGQRPLYNAYIETDPADPISVYGKSKLLGEENIKAIDYECYSILRTAWLYGLHGKNFLKTMLRLVLSDPQKEYRVVSDQFGSPTSTDSLVRQIHAVIDNNAYGVFHATTQGYCSWYEFACEFFALMGIEHRLVPCSTEEYPKPAKRPANSILENRHLQSLSIDCFLSWKDELGLFVNAYRDQLLQQARV